MASATATAKPTGHASTSSLLSLSVNGGARRERRRARLPFGTGPTGARLASDDHGTATLAALAGIALLALSALLYFGQEHFIFFPRPNDVALLRQLQAQRIRIPSRDTDLEGWWVDNPGAARARVILYFGGNAENVLFTAATGRQLHARRMLVTNYRGYGSTAGRPSQRALFQDALAIYDHVVGSGVPASDIVVMGRSLGSDVAAMLAGERAVRARAVLVTPFDSLAAVAAGHYPFLPVRLMLKHPFPSVDYARRAHVPAPMLAAEHDAVIPPVHAQRLRGAVDLTRHTVC